MDAGRGDRSDAGIQVEFGVLFDVVYGHIVFLCIDVYGRPQPKAVHLGHPQRTT